MVPFCGECGSCCFRQQFIPLLLGVSNHFQKRHVTGTFPTTREGVGLKVAHPSQDPTLTPSLSFSRKYIQIHKNKHDVIIGIFLETAWIYYLLSSILDNNSYCDYLQTTPHEALHLVGVMPHVRTVGIPAEEPSSLHWNQKK